MKRRKSQARLARRIKSYEDTAERMSPSQLRAVKKPGSQKKT